MAARYRASRRRASQALLFARSTPYDASHKDPQAALWIRRRDLASRRVRYGHRQPHLLLRREGWAVHANRMYQLC